MNETHWNTQALNQSEMDGMQNFEENKVHKGGILAMMTSCLIFFKQESKFRKITLLSIIPPPKISPMYEKALRSL
jgi:hypothetical protein